MTDHRHPHRYLHQNRYRAPLPPMSPLLSQEEIVRRIETVRAGLLPSRFCPNCGHQTLVSDRRDRRAS